MIRKTIILIIVSLGIVFYLFKKKEVKEVENSKEVIFHLDQSLKIFENSQNKLKLSEKISDLKLIVESEKYIRNYQINDEFLHYEFNFFNYFERSNQYIENIEKISSSLDRIMIINKILNLNYYLSEEENNYIPEYKALILFERLYYYFKLEIPLDSSLKFGGLPNYVLERNKELETLCYYVYLIFQLKKSKNYLKFSEKQKKTILQYENENNEIIKNQCLEWFK